MVKRFIGFGLGRTMISTTCLDRRYGEPRKKFKQEIIMKQTLDVYMEVIIAE
jgi:hypothetical protein